MPQRSIGNAYLAHEGVALFEFRGGGIVIPRPPIPAWCKSLWVVKRGKSLRLAEKSPFLENFLVEAKEFWRSKATGAADSGNWIERDIAGNEVPLQAFALRLDGRRVLLIRNLSGSFAQQQQLFQTARDSLLEHERLIREVQKKEILLHCIIHDLSQPLTAMRGCFDLLLDKNLSPEVAKILLTGTRESRRQEQMIRGVLEAFSADLQSQETGGRSVALSADLVSCARHALEQFAPAFAERGVHLALAPPGGSAQDWSVAGDAARIDRIFGNLLENSLRYSPRGSSVTIGVENDGAALLAFVDDEGPGLPPDSSLEQIFALFGKGGDRPGKAGLGLYFCKMTVERWGGSIGAENRRDRGSRFWFRLPRSAEQPREPDVAASALIPAPAPTGAAVVTPVPEKSLRIVVAEDNETLCELAIEILRTRGHWPTPASDGRAALAAFDAVHPDVILLDQEMPQMSGAEVARAIREREEISGAARTVLIGVSGNASTEDRRLALESGMDAFLAKPFDRIALLRAVEAPLSAPLETTESVGAGPSPAGSLRHQLERVTGGNKKLMRTIAATFLSDLPGKLCAIQRALAAHDFEELAAAAHSLKGALGIFAPGGKLFAKAKNLEAMGRGCQMEGAAEQFMALSDDLARLARELHSLFPDCMAKER